MRRREIGICLQELRNSLADRDQAHRDGVLDERITEKSIAINALDK
jgi:hypothetical protein